MGTDSLRWVSLVARGVTGAARLPPSRPCCRHGDRSRATPQDLSLSHPALASSSSARLPSPGLAFWGLCQALPPLGWRVGPAAQHPAPRPSLPGPALTLPHLPAPPVSFLWQPPPLRLAPPATPHPAPLCTPAPSHSSEAPSHAQLFSRLAPWSLPSCPGSTQLVRTP